VVIDDGNPAMTFDDWVALLAEDETTDVDAGAAEIIGMRERGER
jgi:hypothetical protein